MRSQSSPSRYARDAWRSGLPGSNGAGRFERAADVAPQRCQEIAPTGAAQCGRGGDSLAFHPLEPVDSLLESLGLAKGCDSNSGAAREGIAREPNGSGGAPINVYCGTHAAGDISSNGRPTNSNMVNTAPDFVMNS